MIQKIDVTLSQCKNINGIKKKPYIYIYILRESIARKNLQGKGFIKALTDQKI